MDTILTYFDNMFLALPATEAVQKAREELLSMAQERYLDLKEEGRSENEAVGTVIEEFGNIEELADELGVKTIASDPQERYLMKEDAERYFVANEKADRCLGFGIFLLFVSPVLLIFLGCLNTGDRPIVSPAIYGCLGAPFLLVFLAAGLSLVFYSSFIRKPWKEMKQQRFRMDGIAKRYVEECYEEQQKFFAFHIMIALSLLVIGVIPPIIMGVQFANVPPAVRGIAVDIFMVLYGISIYSFIRAGMSQKRLKIIRGQGRFGRKRKKM